MPPFIHSSVLSLLLSCSSPLFCWQLSADGEASGERISKYSWDSLLLYRHAWDHTAVLIPPANITMAIVLSSFPLCHITCTRAHTHGSTDSSLIIRWHGQRWYNHWRWFAAWGYVHVCVWECEAVSNWVRVNAFLTPVTSMTLMAASCPVLTWRPWWKEKWRNSQRQEKRIC